MYPNFRSPCPVASTLDLLGDKWSLVVLRTIFSGSHRYHELEGMAERITTSTLADRLDRLEAFGLVEKTPYQTRPTRYEYRLTARGADTLPVLQALAAWGDKHIPDRWQRPDWFLAAAPEDFYPMANK